MRNTTLFIPGDFSDNLFANNNKLKVHKSNKLTQITNKANKVTVRSPTLLDLVIISKVQTLTPMMLFRKKLEIMTVDITKFERSPVLFRLFRYLGNYIKDAFFFNFHETHNILMQPVTLTVINSRVKVFTEYFTSCLEDCVPLLPRALQDRLHHQ